MVDRLGGADAVLVEACGTGVRQVVLAPPSSPRPAAVSADATSNACAPASRRASRVLYVPELFTRATGRRVVSLVASALADELDVG